MYNLCSKDLNMVKYANAVPLHLARFSLKAILPVFFLVIFTAQSRSAFASGPSLLLNGPSYFSLAYAGNNLWNPGMEFGAGFLLHTFPEHSSRNRPLSRELFFSSGIGMYLDPGSHAAIYSQYGGVFRSTGPKGWNHSFEILPAGIYRSFLPETWAVGEGGSPEKVFLPGRTYFAPGIGYQVGHAFSEKHDREWFAGCSMTLLMPFNTYVMPVLTIDIGWRFSGRKEGK